MGRTKQAATTEPEGDWVQVGPVVRIGASPVLLTAAQAAAIARDYGQPVADMLTANVKAMQADHYAKMAAIIQAGLEATAPDEPPRGPILLSHGEVAELLDISVATVKRLVQDGRLPKPVQISAHRIGHRWTDVRDFARSTGKGDKVQR
jgi:excisionase family DNA binding protein